MRGPVGAYRHHLPSGAAALVVFVIPVQRRTIVSARSRFDLIFDFTLLIAFGIAYATNFTGLEVHEWFGLAFGLALLVHLTLHWDWVVRTSRRMLSTTGRRRLMWIANLLLCFDLTLCVGSDVIISSFAIPALGIHFHGVSEFWSSLHDKTAVVAIGLIAIHAALDWRWVVSVTRRMFRLDRRPHETVDVEA